MSTTTLVIRTSTRKLLEEMKRKYEAKSIDETIRKLVDNAENIPESLFGAHPKMKTFSKPDEIEDHEM